MTKYVMSSLPLFFPEIYVAYNYRITRSSGVRFVRSISLEDLWLTSLIITQSPSHEVPSRTDFDMDNNDREVRWFLA